MQRKHLLFGLTALPILVVDQATKLYVDAVMQYGEMIPVVPNFFDITYLRNKGAAFSFLADFRFRLPFFILVSLVAMGAILSFYRKLRDDQNFTAVCLALIFSGALGNLIDRVRLGEVIDFIYVHWYNHYWPAFNVADSAICVGVFLLAVDMWLEEKRLKKLGDGK